MLRWTFSLAVGGFAAGCLVAGLVWLPPTGLAAGEVPPSFTNASALQILQQNCLRCHNAEKQRGELDLSSYQSAMLGGGGGPALVPAQPEKSPLFLRAKEGSMPPETDGRRLSESELKMLVEWIVAGAKWPETKPTTPPSANATGAALVPATEQNAPAVSPVDHSRPELRQRPPNQISAPYWRSKLACRAFHQRGPLGRSR